MKYLPLGYIFKGILLLFYLQNIHFTPNIPLKIIIFLSIFTEKNGKTYLFSGDIFWRFDDETFTLDPGYPKSIARWHGIPSNLDAATTLSNGQTIFFRGSKYWIFNNRWIRPEIGYPRSIASLLNCR